MQHIFLFVIKLLVLTMVLQQNAYAYLDPGTGSILIQSLIAAAVAGAYTIKMYWYKIKGFFSRSTENPTESKEFAAKDSKENLDD